MADPAAVKSKNLLPLLSNIEVTILGEVMVGPVPKTTTPEPVSSVKALSNAKEAADVVRAEEPLVKTALSAVKPETVNPVKVGEAPELMFWMVLTTPEAAVKLVALKAATPLVAPSAAALAAVMVYVSPDREVEIPWPAVPLMAKVSPWTMVDEPESEVVLNSVPLIWVEITWPEPLITGVPLTDSTLSQPEPIFRAVSAA